MVSNQTYVPNEERTRFLLAHLQTVIVPHRQTWIPQQFVYPERWRCDYRIISLLMLALLLLAHAQQLLCDDTVFSATTEVQLLSAAWGPIAACAPVPPPLQSRVLVREKLPRKENYAAALGWCALLSPQLCYQHQMRSSQARFPHKVPSVHPQDGREKRLVPLPLSCFGCLAAAVVVAEWAVEGVCGGDVYQATISHSYLQCHFSS